MGANTALRLNDDVFLDVVGLQIALDPYLVDPVGAGAVGRFPHLHLVLVTEDRQHDLRRRILPARLGDLLWASHVSAQVGVVIAEASGRFFAMAEGSFVLPEQPGEHLAVEPLVRRPEVGKVFAGAGGKIGIL